MLGYDVDPRGGRLVVNEDGAARVRAIFNLYLEHRSVIAVVRDVNGRGWTTKQWATKDGREHRGRPIGKAEVYKILTKRRLHRPGEPQGNGLSRRALGHPRSCRLPET